MELSEEIKENIVSYIMAARLDKSFNSQYEVGQWLRSIKKVYGYTLSEKQYRELWDFGIDSIESDDNE